MQCPKCETDMEKKNEYESGNIRFQRYTCGSCYNEQSKALGISGGMPDGT